MWHTKPKIVQIETINLDETCEKFMHKALKHYDRPQSELPITAKQYKQLEAGTHVYIPGAGVAPITLDEDELQRTK